MKLWQLCSGNDLRAQRKMAAWVSVCQSSRKFKIMAPQGHWMQHVVLVWIQTGLKPCVNASWQLIGTQREYGCDEAALEQTCSSVSLQHIWKELKDPSTGTTCRNKNSYCRWLLSCPPKWIQGCNVLDSFPEPSIIIRALFGGSADFKRTSVTDRYIHTSSNSPFLSRWQIIYKTSSLLAQPASIAGFNSWL